MRTGWLSVDIVIVFILQNYAEAESNANEFAFGQFLHCMFWGMFRGMLLPDGPGGFCTGKVYLIRNKLVHFPRKGRTRKANRLAAGPTIQFHLGESVPKYRGNGSLPATPPPLPPREDKTCDTHLSNLHGRGSTVEKQNLLEHCY